jgi:protein ImuB
VVHEFGQRGFTIRAAVADTIGAAWALAHYGGGPAWSVASEGAMAEAIGPLPVEALRLEPEATEWLRELGILWIDELERLPRAGLATRFGAQVLERLDQAMGRRTEVLVPYRPLPPVEACRSFEYPIEERADLERVLGRLVKSVMERLRQRGQGVRRLECRLDCEAGRSIPFSVGLFRPTGSARHLMELVQLRLDQVTVPEPVSSVSVCAAASDRLGAGQAEMFAGSSGQENPQELAKLIDRLSSRLGRACVVRPRLVPDAQPECACCYEPLVGSSPARGITACLQAAPKRPLRLCPSPLPVAVMSVVPEGPPISFRLRGQECRITHARGPERIETGWWRGRPAERDYYCAETDGGQRVWLFRRISDGRWFLHGWFD